MLELLVLFLYLIDLFWGSLSVALVLSSFGCDNYVTLGNSLKFYTFDEIKDNSKDIEM